MLKIKVQTIIVDGGLARNEPSPEFVSQMAASLQQDGQLTPIVVIAKHASYYLAAGLRRLRAAEKLGWEEINAIVLDDDARSPLHLGAIENLVREDMTTSEKAASVARLMDELGWTSEDVARAGIVKSSSTARRYKQFMEENPEIIDLVRRTESDEVGALTEYHVRVTRGLELPDIVRRGILSKSNREGLSASQTMAVAQAIAIDLEAGDGERADELMVKKNFDPNIHNADKEKKRIEKKTSSAKHLSTNAETGEMAKTGKNEEQSKEPDLWADGQNIYPKNTLRVWAVGEIQADDGVMEVSKMHFFVPSPSAAVWLIKGMDIAHLMNSDIVSMTYGLRVFDGNRWNEWRDQKGEDITTYVNSIKYDMPFKPYEKSTQ